MKTQLCRPARGKASYTDQYKQEALELWRRSGRSAAKVGAELGIRPPLLYRWARLERAPEATKSNGKSGETAPIQEGPEHKGKVLCHGFFGVLGCQFS